MRGYARARWALGATTLAMIATACGGGGGGNTGGSAASSAAGAASSAAGGASSAAAGGASSAAGGASSAASGAAGGGGAASGKLVYGGCKPENPLIPAGTNEVCGGRVVDALFTGLVVYNPDDASPVNAVAQSIDTTDNKKFTIKLNNNYKFDDGTPVDAKSFVDAWNYSAYGPNALKNSYFFAPIQGFEDVQGEDSDGDGKLEKQPKAKKMSGLKVVDPQTFEVTLSSPSSVFPVMVGYTAFSPLPEAFFNDPKAFGKKPIGNGPFKMVGGNGDTGYDLTAVEDYQGPDKSKIKDLTFKTYQSPEAEYADLQADNVDFVEQVPPNVLAGDQYKNDLQDRAINKPVGIIQTSTFPLYQDKFKNPDLRKAISLAIDRDTITKQIYNGGRTPATGWVSPVVNGYKEGACGEFCTYDPAKAKEYLQKAGGFNGTLTYAYNADGAGNKEAAEAITNSIKNALGIDAQPKPYVDFSTLRTDVTAKKMTGLFRTGWQMDYPSIENFLVPLYATGASSNDGKWSNKQFDALVKEAASLTGDQANAKYQEAEQVLAQDMPVIPLWYQAAQSGWSTKIDNVKVTPFGTLDLAGVTVKQ